MKITLLTNVSQFLAKFFLKKKVNITEKEYEKNISDNRHDVSNNGYCIYEGDNLSETPHP